MTRTSVMERLGRMEEGLFSDENLDIFYKNPKIAPELHKANRILLGKELKELARGKAEYTVKEGLINEGKRLDGAVILVGEDYPRRGDIYIDSEVAKSGDKPKKYYTYAHECVHKYIPHIKNDSVVDYWVGHYLEDLKNDKDSEVANTARIAYEGWKDRQSARVKEFGPILGGDGAYSPDLRYKEAQDTGGYTTEKMIDRGIDLIFGPLKLGEKTIREFFGNYSGLSIGTNPEVADFASDIPKYIVSEWGKARKKEEEITKAEEEAKKT